MPTNVNPQQDAPDHGIKRIPATPTEVAAAKLRLVLDERLGRETPDWVIRLANAERRSA